jgi:hypothetical protein
MNEAQYLGVENKAVASLLSASMDASLASGLSGALVLEAHLQAADPSEARSAAIAAALAGLVHVVQSQELRIDLWSGLVGVLYAIEYARHAVPEHMNPSVEQFVDEMDSMLLEYIEAHADDMHFDLVSGLAGFGAYALMRTSDASARALYGRVEQALLARHEQGDSGIFWRTTPALVGPNASDHSRQFGHIDFGIAHGQSGVILLLAAGLKYGLSANSSRTESALRSATDFVVGYAGNRTPYARYPYYEPQSLGGPSRLAWCYGDLSAALSIFCAAEQLASSELRAAAEQIVLRRLEQPVETFALEDLGLCHGHSGIFLMLEKMSRGEGHAQIRAHADAFRSHLKPVDNLEFGLHQRADLLDGAAGVLLASRGHPAQSRHAWDTCLCLGF